MIVAFTGALLVALIVPTYEQNIQAVPISPCPNVFQYTSTDVGPSSRWYGVINLSTDNTLHSLWLNIVLDRKADILGTWIGDITTTDNIDFKIENTTLKITPGPATPMRFFVQYSGSDSTPKLQAIRLNGREICNADTPQPTVDIPDLSESTINVRRPDTSNGYRPNSRPDVRPEDYIQSRPVQSPNVDSEYSRPVYVRPDSFIPNPSSIAEGDASQKIDNQGRPVNNRHHQATATQRPTRRPEIPEYVSNVGDNDYFEGGQPLLIIPTSSSSNTNPKNNNRGGQAQCGTVVRNNPNPLVINGVPTLEGQWPWQIALYQTQTVDNKYICGGTLVSHRHVITAAHCVTKKKSMQKVEKNTLTVYLGKHNLRTSVDGVQIKFVHNIIVYPEYNVSTYNRDLAILELREPVDYSDWVRPACLWPESEIDLQNIIGKKGSVVGWGFDDRGIATEELTMVEMPVVDQETCLRSYNEFFVRFTSSYTYCAGYRDGTSVCNGDSGGGMVFQSNGIWYLRGLVSLSVARQNEYRCDPSHYVIFTDIAKLLPWVKQNVYDY